jgi:ribonuclease HI
METHHIIYTDGGSRGNPGPAALGVYLATLDKRYSEYLDTTTNNVAEYKAIVFALKKAKQLLGSEKCEGAEIEVRSDSQLIVNQLEGKFKLKEEDLFKYFIDVWNLKQEFKSVRFVHIPREQNKIADSLVNEELDRHTRKGLF